MEDFIQVTISGISEEKSDILVAALSRIGYTGFEEEENILHAFIEEKNFDEEEITALLLPDGLSFSKKTIAFKNWNEEWEQNFEPVVIGDFCAVRASFHQPIKNVEHEIIITPKMSFGTGHHATTYMMIEGIHAIDCNGKRMLDFGTGTGVLAILAEKCGAARILAIDNDDLCIGNATENIMENHCQSIVVQKSDSLEGTGIFDIILANINKNIILEHFDQFRQHLETDGVLLLSGLLAEDFKDIQTVADQHNFLVWPPKERENWISVRLDKKEYR